MVKYMVLKLIHVFEREGKYETILQLSFQERLDARDI